MTAVLSHPMSIVVVVVFSDSSSFVHVYSDNLKSCELILIQVSVRIAHETRRNVFSDDRNYITDFGSGKVKFSL